MGKATFVESDSVNKTWSDLKTYQEIKKMEQNSGSDMRYRNRLEKGTVLNPKSRVYEKGQSARLVT